MDITIPCPGCGTDQTAGVIANGCIVDGLAFVHAHCFKCRNEFNVIVDWLECNIIYENNFQKL